MLRDDRHKATWAAEELFVELPACGMSLQTLAMDMHTLLQNLHVLAWQSG